MAEAHYAQIAPHLYCGPVVGAANIHLAASYSKFPDPRIASSAGSGFHARILKSPIRLGQWLCDSLRRRPASGVELDEAVALAHPYAADGRLHLEMADHPID